MSIATLLIATRNRAKQLRSALLTIDKEDYKNIDMVIIDDGSTDGTAELLKESGYAEMAHVSTIKRNGGYRRNPGAVLNAGHRFAQTHVVIEQGGEVCHMNDCVTPLLDVCRPGMVALARVHHGEERDMFTIAGMIERGEYKFPANYIPNEIRTRGRDWVVPIINGIKLYCGKERPAPFLFLGAIHQDDFNAVGGYDESLPNRNDEDLANRLLAKGVRFCFVGNAVAFHLRHDKS